MALTPQERKARIPYGALTEIARRNGCTLGHVSQVVNGKRRSRRIEVAVARRIGLPVHLVFPPLVDREADLVGSEPLEKAS